METIKYLRVSATTTCHANCWYCFNESQPFDFSMLEDIHGFEWVINQMVSDYGTEIVRFTGGEPLENPNIIVLLEIAKSAGLKRVGLTTNGDRLLEMAANIKQVAPDEIAVHLHYLDANKTPVNMRKVEDSIEVIRRNFQNVKFNIVVTKQNHEYVESVVAYAIRNGVNLLLLDLLQAGNTDTDFEENFCSLDSIRQYLLTCGLKESTENINSKIYSSVDCSIKLLDHYAEANTRNSYCTRALTYHPILLTPKFELSLCTHFGKRVISIADIIVQRDKEKLRDAISELRNSLAQCHDCFNRTALNEYNNHANVGGVLS